MLLAIYNCISIPFNASFAPDPIIYYEIWEGLVDVCFAVDIVINFRTTYVNSSTGLEVIGGWKVAWNYIRSGRFFVDLMASIPFERFFLLFFEAGDSQTAFQLLGLLKLIRLLRLGRVIRYMKFKTGLKIGIRIVQLLFFLLMIVHWIACLWYLLV
jgi:potassium voltage-gated channel Eag-related subfamily H protein 6